LPQANGKPAARRRRTRRHRRFDGVVPPTRKLMKLDTDPRDANAELHGFEPLRITLALGALLLGLLLGI